MQKTGERGEQQAGGPHPECACLPVQPVVFVVGEPDGQNIGPAGIGSRSVSRRGAGSIGHMREPEIAILGELRRVSVVLVEVDQTAQRPLIPESSPPAYFSPRRRAS